MARDGVAGEGRALPPKNAVYGELVTVGGKVVVDGVTKAPLVGCRNPAA